MNIFDVLGDPVRRRIIELLADGEQPAGAVGEAVMAEFGIRQPAVSNQLRTLRTAGVVEVEPQGARRIYRLAPGALEEVAGWLDRYTRLWPQRLDALETELTRGRRGRAAEEDQTDGRPDDPSPDGQQPPPPAHLPAQLPGESGRGA